MKEKLRHTIQMMLLWKWLQAENDVQEFLSTISHCDWQTREMIIQSLFTHCVYIARAFDHLFISFIVTRCSCFVLLNLSIITKKKKIEMELFGPHYMTTGTWMAQINNKTMLTAINNRRRGKITHLENGIVHC